MSFRFQFRRGTTAERNASNPVLAAGEPAVVLDSGQPAELVLGDGATAMADLRAAVWDDDARLALADTATQPGDLGTAAAADVGDFATAGQGAKADTAVQPADLTAYALKTEVPTSQTLDDLGDTFHYLHGVGSTNGVPLDPAGTLAAVSNAAAIHPSELVMIDLDYRKTADGTLASIHDATTANVSNVNVTVAETAFRDLPPVIKPILYGGGQTAQPIAGIEEVLVAARGRAVFSIEIKDGLPAVPEAIGLAARLGMADKIVWNTGDPAVVAAIVAAGGRAFMFNCRTSADYDAAQAAGAWMVDVPTDASTPLIDYAVAKGFARIIRGFATTAGVPVATDSFSQLVGMDPRLDAAATDATGYLDRPGGANVRSVNNIAGMVRTGKRAPGLRIVNSSNITDWLTPGRLHVYKAGPMVYTFGSLAGTPATTGTLTLKVVFDTLPTTLTQSIRFKLFSPTEAPVNASANTVEGYVLYVQGDGKMAFSNIPAGGGTPTYMGIPDVPGAAFVAGTEYTITLEWDDSNPASKKIRLTRVDTGGTSGWFDETAGGKPIWRGKYHSLFSNLTTGVGAVTDFAVS